MDVLLIEPDSVEASCYIAALEMAGNHVRHVTTAQAAIQVADERVPEVVVLELQLPRHNGVEFLYEFRSYSEWLYVPVLVYSYVPPSELASSVTLRNELGVYEVLHKPGSNLAQLVASVQAAPVVRHT